jgi:FO synthase subunit 2
MFGFLEVSPQVGEVLERALEGDRLETSDAELLLNTTGDDFLALGLVANKIRKDRVGEDITYVVNRNINFTNICEGTCLFCAYHKKEGEPGSYLLSLEEIEKRVKEARDAGATEICVQGGLNPDLEMEYYLSILDIIEEAGLHAHSFSPMEVYYLSLKTGLEVDEVLSLLKERGLGSMPGTAAEVLDDAVRRTLCPDKLTAGEWAQVVETAHRSGIPTTATLLYGHVETSAQNARHLEVIRDIQDRTGGFTEFVPLSFIHRNTEVYRRGTSRPGATGIEDLKVYAVSRLFLDNFRNIQVSWVKLGRKFAQVALMYGANDLGGTLMEESISKSAGAGGEMMGVEELKRVIENLGRRPIQRDTLYNRI